MTDVTAQTFREAAAFYRRKGSVDSPELTKAERAVATGNRRHAELMDAAAEQREQLDAALFKLQQYYLTDDVQEQVATLTAERDAARAQRDEAIKELQDYQYQEDLCSRTE